MKSIGIILGMVGILFSCSPSTNTTSTQKKEATTMTIEIDHFLQACTGEGPMLCERYRKEGEEEWQYAYEGIEGLKFKWGVRQTIEIECTGDDMTGCKLVKLVKEEPFSAAEDFQLVIMDETGEPYLYLKSGDGGNWTYFGSIGADVKDEGLAKQVGSLSAEGGKASMGTFSYNIDRSQLILKSIP